ncbi:hypothetical protein GCM10009767_32080 [Kocuria aegyptia]|uniref:Uncharacterized protein n=1 Tax=Kocuria aegyptia TaxID=330943 RepID=A0ABN2L1G2_9MICC
MNCGSRPGAALFGRTGEAAGRIGARAAETGDGKERLPDRRLGGSRTGGVRSLRARRPAAGAPSAGDATTGRTRSVPAVRTTGPVAGPVRLCFY